MRIIISPAKKMRVDSDTYVCKDLPVFEAETRQIMTYLQNLSYEDQKAVWKCNDKIAMENHQRLADMDLHANLTPAILAYDGIQYQYMAPAVFEDGQFEYVQEHLRILSAFYGVVKPLDGLVPYRLEMQARLAQPIEQVLPSSEETGQSSNQVNVPSAGAVTNFYDFWGDKLYEEVVGPKRVIINLASKEYSKCIEKYLKPEDHLITCVFGELSGDKVVQKGVYAKMARGEMVRYMAAHKVEDPEDIKKFDWSGYQFDESRSDDKKYVFIKPSNN